MDDSIIKERILTQCYSLSMLRHQREHARLNERVDEVTTNDTRIDIEINQLAKLMEEREAEL